MPGHLASVSLIVGCAVVAASVATVVIVGLAPQREQQSSITFDGSIIPGQTSELLAGMRIPDFQLIDHNGQAIDASIFDGRLTIVDFFFTRCPGPCPMLTQQMRRIQKELVGTDIRFISFSVDSENEPPEALRAYAATNGADLSNWTFVTGDAVQIRSIVTDGLQFALERDPSVRIDLGGGKTGDNIIHPTHLILIGPDRSVWALAGFTNEEHIQLLIDGARRLLEGLKGG